MFIEILNYGSDKYCKAKCPTCPQNISGPNSGPYYGRLLEVFASIQKKFPGKKIPFSLQSDITEIPTVLELFWSGESNLEQIGCNIKLPFDSEAVKNAINFLTAKIPNIKLSLFLENRGFLSNYESDILELVEIFNNSTIKDFSIACHNNSIRKEIFDGKIEQLFQANYRLFEKMEICSNAVHSMKYQLIRTYPMSQNQYQELGSMGSYTTRNGRKLIIAERILSFREKVVPYENLINAYEKYHRVDVQEDHFKSTEMLIALSPIGVRINHRSTDIQNPYLWLSYDELFDALETATTQAQFCKNLIKTANKTLKLVNSDTVVSEITYETIQQIAEARRKLS